MTLPALSFPSRANGQTIDASHIDALQDVVARLMTQRYDVREWGIALDGASDQAALLNQAALDVQALGRGAMLYIPYGVVRIESTFTKRWGVPIVGGFGGGSVGLSNRYPSIDWYGAAGGTMIAYENTVPLTGDIYNGYEFIENLFIRGRGVAGTGILLPSAIRIDQGTHFNRVAVSGCTDYGLDFQSAINFHNKDFRYDGIAKYAIRTRGGFGVMSFDGFTCDNDLGSTSTPGGGFFLFDNATSPVTGVLSVNFANAKTEANSPITFGGTQEAMFKFAVDPTKGLQVIAKFEHVFQRPDPALTIPQNHGIIVTPAHDIVALRLIDCQMSITGVPSYSQPQGSQADVFDDFYHSDTLIAPFNRNRGVDNSIYWTAVEQVGLWHLQGDMMQDGKPASPILYNTTAMADWAGFRQLQRGQLLSNPADIGVARMSVQRNDSAQGAGSIGNLTGRTASVTSGSNLVTMNDTSGLFGGLELTIAGAGTNLIRYVTSPTTLTWDGNASATVSGAAATLNPHTFREFQLVPYAAAAPSSGAWKKGDIAANNGSGDHTGWRCIVAGTPGTWEKIPGRKQITVPLGPFFVPAVPGTATTQAKRQVFTGATAVALNPNDPKMNVDGTVVGVLIESDAARTAGTAEVRVRVNGTATAFAGGAVVLSGTAGHSTSWSDFEAESGGVAFNNGDTVGAALVTSGFTPTTANVAIWLYCLVDAY